MTSNIRLYAWKPQLHGEYSFFVAAHSEEEAREAVEKYAVEERDAYFYIEDYELTVLEVGQVITNDNS